MQKCPERDIAPIGGSRTNGRGESGDGVGFPEKCRYFCGDYREVNGKDTLPQPTFMDRSPTSSPRIVRSLLALTGSFAWLCAAVTIRQGLLLSSQSPLLWGVALCGLLGGIAAWVVALLASESWIDVQLARWTGFLHRTREVFPATGHRAGASLVLFGTLLFATNTYWVSQHQDSPFDDDQGAFLITAREIHDHGGLTSLWNDLWSGRFEEANRHPLFLAIQSLHPTVDFGRGASCLLAIVTAGFALLIVWRRMGPLTAGVLAVLLGTNGAWLYHAPRVVCESLLTGLAGVAWLVLSRESGVGSREPVELVAGSSGHPPSAIRQLPSSSLVGVLLGLAYLTKGTGLLLLGGTSLAFGVLAVWSRGERRRGIASFTALILAFVVTASPLLTRNLIRYGSATYNINSYLLWVDAYESPVAMADRMTLQEARDAYLSTHSVTDLIEREATGLAWEAFIGLRTLGPAPWNDARVLFGLPLFALGLLGLCHTPRLPALVLILWTGIMWVMMAWYVPIAAGDRFMMPLLIPWLTLAANGLVRILSLSTAPHAATPRIVLGAILWGVVTTVLVWTRGDLWVC